MPRVKQASKPKLTNKAAAVKVLGAAGVGLSLVGSASASTMPTAGIPQSGNASPNHRFVLSEEEMTDVSLATFHLFDRENLNWPGVGVVAAAARVARVARVPGERAATAAKSHEKRRWDGGRITSASGKHER